MWKTILDNINSLILANWKNLFFVLVGILIGTFLISCSAVNAVVDTTQEVVNDAVEYVTGGDEEADE